MRARLKAVAGALALVLLGACDKALPPAGARAPGQSDRQAIELIRYYGCGTCHAIPGVPSATGLVGPPLARLKSRNYIGGVLTNNLDNLTRWIRNPREIAPKTAMPDVGVSEADAKVIAGYLYTR
jgi:cytochrome c